MSHLDRLNEGPPRPTIEQINPETSTEQEREEIQEAMAAWGAAFSAILGTLGSPPVGFGSALLRAPVLHSSVAVASDTVTLATPGTISAVSEVGGAALRLRPLGTPAAGEVLVTYGADYRPTLTFNASDSVASIAVLQDVIPLAFVQAILADP